MDFDVIFQLGFISSKSPIEPQNDNLGFNMDLRELPRCVFELKIDRKQDNDQT